jgi:hypothetical protein
MSVKIYGGRRLDGGIAKVYPRLLAVKPQAQAIAQKLTNRFMAHQMVTMPKSANMFTQAWTEMADRQHRIVTTMRRDPSVDFNFDILLFPGKSQTLAILQAERDEYEEWFDSLDWVHDYAYWTNTDRPDDMTKKMWDLRGEAWDKALGESSVPADNCLLFQFASSSRIRPPKMSDLEETIKEMSRSLTEVPC